MKLEHAFGVVTIREIGACQLDECIKLIKDGYGNLPGIAFPIFHLGRIDRLQGDYASAHTHLTEGIQIV